VKPTATVKPLLNVRQIADDFAVPSTME